MSNGYELLSDDRKLKVILHKTKVFAGSIQQDLFTANLFVKYNGGWEKTDTTYTYRSQEEFLYQFVRAGAFTDAFKELKEHYSDAIPKV